MVCPKTKIANAKRVYLVRYRFGYNSLVVGTAKRKVARLGLVKLTSRFYSVAYVNYVRIIAGQKRGEKNNDKRTNRK